MIALRVHAFQGFLVLWTLGLGVLCLPLLVLPRTVIREVARFWARCVLAGLRVLVGQRWELRGAGHLPHAAAIVACRHQSAWDTIVFLALLPDAAYVLKRELLRIPVYGWYARKLGHIGIDRGGHAGALKRMIRDAEAALAAGRQVVIFPEGTRTPPGEARPYHPGVAALYRQLGAPVVPVALNSGLYWRRRAFTKRPGTIVLKALPPIPPGLERAAFMRRLQAAIDGESERLGRDGAT